MDIMEDLYTTTFSNNESFFKKAAAEIESIRAQIAELEAKNERLRMALADTEATIAEQAAELESLRKDAERYRWLRDGNQQLHGDDPCVSDSCFNQYFESDLDNEVDKLIERNKAIFAAIAEAPKQEK